MADDDFNQPQLIPQDSPVAEKSIIVYQPQGQGQEIELPADPAHNTVWATQKQVAYILDLSIPTVNEHIANFRKQRGEAADSSIRKIRILAQDGKARWVEHYNMTIVTYVGFRAQATERVIAFQDWVGQSLDRMIRNTRLAALPETVTTRKQLKAIRHGTDSGLSWEESREWLTARQKFTEAHKYVSAVRDGYGVRGQHYAKLSNIDFRNGALMTQDEWRQQHGIKGSALDHLSTLDLVSITYAKLRAAALYEKRQPPTYTEVETLTESIREDCEINRRILSQILPDRFLIPLPEKPEQRKLKASNE